MRGILLAGAVAAIGTLTAYCESDAFSVRQVFRPERFTRGDTTMRAVQDADRAAWIRPPKANEGFFRFRRDFASDGSPLRFDVTADERFVLLLDGRTVASGPHRGLVDHWYYQSYEVTGLSAGTHRLEALVWRIGWAEPLAQLSWNIGFLLKAEGAYDAALTTGKADWRVAPAGGTRCEGNGNGNLFGVGCRYVVEGTSFLTAEPDEGSWAKAGVTRGPIREETAYGVIPAGWKIFPTERKDQLSVRRTPGRVVNAERDLGRPFDVPAKTTVEYLWNLDDYVCGYPELTVAGGRGAKVEWAWTESLRGADGKKGDRNAWQGKKVTECLEDVFLPDGRKSAFFTTPWWRCGKWCRLRITTADEPLAVQRVEIREERYPLSFDAAFACDDPSVSEIVRLCRRTMENCCHEMLMDCPFYEQQMYPGDTRIQLQVLNAQTRDDRMARFATSVFDYGRRSDGFVEMNAPTRMTQESSTFTLCWLLMFRDYAMWRDNAAFLKARMPGVRNALMNYEHYENASGLLVGLPGWTFVDWVDGWTRGVPPDGLADSGKASAIINLFYLHALRSVADVEEALAERQFAERWRERADRLSQAILGAFWCEEKGLLADSVRKNSFSEHAQALAITAGLLTPERKAHAIRALADAKDLHKASASFSYYLFAAYAACGRSDLILKRLDIWKNYLAHGANTAFETQDIEARSDCHAWSACPLYYFQTVLAGVEPNAPFFRSVRIAPQPGPLTRIRAKTPSPAGLIETDFDFAGERVSGRIVLPGNLTGTFVWKGEVRKLTPGVNEL